MSMMKVRDKEGERERERMKTRARVFDNVGVSKGVRACEHDRWEK